MGFEPCSHVRRRDRRRRESGAPWRPRGGIAPFALAAPATSGSRPTSGRTRDRGGCDPLDRDADRGDRRGRPTGVRPLLARRPAVLGSDPPALAGARRARADPRIAFADATPAPPRRSSRSSPSRRSGATRSCRCRRRSVYPLFAFLAVRFAISTVTLAPFAIGAACGRCRARGRRRVSSPAVLLAVALRAADRRARADDRVEHRVHHRALRRLHAADRARALPHAGAAAAWVGVVLSLAGLLLLSGAPGRLVARATCSCSANAAGAVAPDRRDGAVRAPLRRAGADVPADDASPRRVRGHRRRRSVSSSRRTTRGLVRADRHGRLRGRARLPGRHLGAVAHDGRACGARVHARGAVRRALRRAAAVRAPRLVGLGRLRGDARRDPARRAGRRGASPATRRRRAGPPRWTRSCSRSLGRALFGAHARRRAASRSRARAERRRRAAHACSRRSACARDRRSSRGDRVASPRPARSSSPAPSPRESRRSSSRRDPRRRVVAGVGGVRHRTAVRGRHRDRRALGRAPARRRPRRRLS